MTSLFFRLLPACLLAAAMPAVHADDTTTAPPQAAFSITKTVTLASQYVSRGMRQTWGRPALQAGLDAVHPGGWSFGTWVSNVSDRFIEGGRVEWDLYAGYAGTYGPLGYSLTAIHYRYPGARIGATGTRYDYTELAPGLSYKPFYAKYYRTVSRDFFGIPGAKEIRALIGDSVDKVSMGAMLVEEAGKTMDEVVSSVRRVSDIVAEISAASAEQSAGISQVNTAIVQMDGVTQQNAALVEEAAAAAESLQQQAATLVALVGEFRIEGADGERPAARLTASAAPARLALQSA